MDLLYIAGLLIFGVLSVTLLINNRKTMKSLTNQTPKAIAAPEEHMLVKTWIEGDNYPAIPSWNWKCSCGVWGSAGNASETSLGSENNVIARFKDHAAGYREANRNVWKEKFEKSEAAFAHYRDKCYCKETNNDLLALGGHHGRTLEA